MDSNLEVHYQPIVDLYTERVIGAEALVRMDGAPPTPDLLAVFKGEDSLAEDYTVAVCHQALETLESLPQDCYVSVNMPAQLFGMGQIGKRLGLEAYGRGELQRFVIEFTEREELHSSGPAAALAARELGVSLALDDFGTPHSYGGLYRLLELGIDFDIIKIDKVFVDRVAIDRHAEKIIRAVAALTRSLQTRTVAEGIESREQATILRAVGVDYGQGWLWHRAMPKEELLALPNLGAAG